MLTVIVQIVSTALVAFQVYLLYKQMKITSKQLENSNKWNRIQATVSIISRYNGIINQIDDSLLDKIKLLSLQQQDLPVNEIDQLLGKASNRKQLFLLCDFFEELALGIKFEYLNEDMVYEQLYTPVVRNYDNLYGYIHIRRIETKMNICGNFEWLAKRWKKKAKKETQEEE